FNEYCNMKLYTLFKRNLTMTLLFKRALLAGFVILPTITTQVVAAPGPKIDLAAVSETTRQLAIKIDWLGRYQDRSLCTTYLNGYNTYAASQSILANDLKVAQPLLSDTITRVKFAIDINCLGQDDMKSVVTSLQSVLQTIS
ncbi:MAG: hypothetical protein ACOYKA_01055, partial [Legionellaceae bacterium]